MRTITEESFRLKAYTPLYKNSLTPSASAPTVPRNPPSADVEEKLAVKGKSNLT